MNVDKVRRKKRPYRKSTSGCGNCKLRRVKCDEDKPSCKNCTRYGVSCNYHTRGPELHVPGEVVDMTTASLGVQCSINSSVLAMINHCLYINYAPYEESKSVYQLKTPDLERLQRFHTRTAAELYNRATGFTYANYIMQLVSQHPYLMHAIMTITAVHDRYIIDPQNSEVTALEIYHWNRAMAMFKQKLDMPITPRDKDAIWINCGLLKGLCLALPKATSPEEAWPLNLAGSSAFDWIKLQDGVHAVYQLISPLDPESIFNNHPSKMLQSPTLPQPSFQQSDTLLPLMNKLFEIDDSFDDLNNPYFNAVQTVSSLMRIQCDMETIFHFFRFVGDLRTELRHLLYIRDPRALLLLAYWYAMVGGSIWHIQRRATIECQSICIYLEKEYAREGLLQQLLHFPKSKCGLLDREKKSC